MTQKLSTQKQVNTRAVLARLQPWQPEWDHGAGASERGTIPARSQLSGRTLSEASIWSS